MNLAEFKTVKDDTATLVVFLSHSILGSGEKQEARLCWLVEEIDMEKVYILCAAVTIYYAGFIHISHRMSPLL